ncbi:hypothetical protein HDU98_000563 [Podochytrium sp. JEL0797]|nr:hypothetical protein HDU98_000563 [Podochytrium sp. JEL0797]
MGWFLGHHLVIEHKHAGVSDQPATLPSLAAPATPAPAIPIASPPAKHSILMAFESSPSADSFTRRALVRTAFRNYEMSRVRAASKLHLVFYWDHYSGTGGGVKFVQVEKAVYHSDVMHATSTFDFLSHIHSLSEYDHVVKLVETVLPNFHRLEQQFQSNNGDATNPVWIHGVDLNETSLFVSWKDAKGVFDPSVYVVSTNLVYQLTHADTGNDDKSPAVMKQAFEVNLGDRVKALNVDSGSSKEAVAPAVVSVELKTGVVVGWTDVGKAGAGDAAVFVVGMDTMDAYFDAVAGFVGV